MNDRVQANDVILKSYDEQRTSYESLKEKSLGLISELLLSEGIKPSIIEGRVKERSSLELKLSRPGKEYQALSEVTDLLGLRIVTYFEDDVDRVAKLIAEEFLLIPEHCVDKRSSLDADRFGYLSLHYVCKISKSRNILSEYKPFTNHVIEVQIRSLLQHAWAEIEHDLGYKAESAIPKPTRRRFSRIAGLLEIVDREFREVRTELEQYKEHVKSQISEGTDAIDIDQVSLAVFLKSSKIVQEQDQLIKTLTSASLAQEIPIPLAVTSLRIAGITTIRSLEKALALHKVTLNFFLASIFAGGRTIGQLPSGLGLFYLPQLMVYRGGGTASLIEMYKQANIGRGAHEKAAKSIAPLLERASQKTTPRTRTAGISRPVKRVGVTNKPVEVGGVLSELRKRVKT